MSRQPTIFLPHGGGPCFFMEWTRGPRDSWDRLAAWLCGLAATLPETPKAVVVVSAHWEAEGFAVTSAAKPLLIYDYYGFPEHTYRLTYPAPGAPALAGRIETLLREAGLPTRLDATRGFDHGVFVPFKLVYPEADVPVVQVSLKATLDPATHLAAGRALAPLRDEGVLLVGSGMSYHNLRAFGPVGGKVSSEFDAWLTGAVTEQSAAARDEALTRWGTAPGSRAAHPREEHLLPLMVVAGAAGADVGRRVFADEVMGLTLSGYQFGGVEAT